MLRDPPPNAGLLADRGSNGSLLPHNAGARKASWSTRMTKLKSISRDTVRTANERIVSRQASTGKFVPSQQKGGRVDSTRVSDVGSRSMPTPPTPAKK